MIGESRPAGIQVDTFGTGTLSDGALADRVRDTFDFRPAAIMRQFDLRHLSARRKKGFYARLAVYGQMGRTDFKVPWESVEAAQALR